MTEHKNLIPVLLGADLNCYNIARAFHEAYGVTSYAFGRYQIGATENTRILHFETIPAVDTPEVLLPTLEKFDQEHPDGIPIVFGCTDNYVKILTDNRDRIPPRFIVPYAEAKLLDDITLKANFYQLCEKYGIPYPKTVVLERGEALGELPFDYPIIIKPSSSILYWKFPFDGMKKVYRAHNREEAISIISSIYASGYPDKLILQDTIPGDDSRMYVLTVYCGRDRKVKQMTLGHVLLEEHTPRGLGNHCAIVTEYKPELMERYRTLLESIGYTGYGNFDIKYDARDGSYRTFEINTRLGRSNYYLTAAGMNPAKMIVRDYVDQEQIDDYQICDNQIYWRYVPDSIVLKYSCEKDRETVRRLLKEKKAYSSMHYAPDLKGNLRRRIFVFLHERNHIKKFRKYYHPEQQG